MVWCWPLLGRYLASWIASRAARSMALTSLRALLAAVFKPKGRRRRMTVTQDNVPASPRRPPVRPDRRLSDHGPTTLVADPLSGLNQRGEGPRQAVGVIEVHATKRLG